jgi:hypothetical protein
MWQACGGVGAQGGKGIRMMEGEAGHASSPVRQEWVGIPAVWSEATEIKGKSAENKAENKWYDSRRLMGSCIFSFAVSSNVSVLISRMEFIWRLKPKLAILSR